MKKLTLALLAIMTVTLSTDALAGRRPCSGKKGGISHCSGTKYICNDGSVSKSKYSCDASIYGKK